MYAVSTALEDLAAALTALPRYSTDTHCLGSDSPFIMGSESAVIGLWRTCGSIPHAFCGSIGSNPSIHPSNSTRSTGPSTVGQVSGSARSPFPLRADCNAITMTRHQLQKEEVGSNMAKSCWQKMEGVSGDVYECGCSEVMKAKEVARLVVSRELHGGACADTEDIRWRLKGSVNPCGRSTNCGRARKKKHGGSLTWFLQ